LLESMRLWRGQTNLCFVRLQSSSFCKSSSGTRAFTPAYLDIEDSDPNNVQIFGRW
jgi:hypothetical protein